MGQYKYEVATIMRAMAMDEFLPAVIAAADDGPDEEADTVSPPPEKKHKGAKAAAAADPPMPSIVRRAPPPLSAVGSKQPRPVVGITRKILRKGSRVLQVGGVLPLDISG